MINFFASLYEWFGLIPFYSTDMGDLLRGWDITCTDYIGTPLYNYIGFAMILTTAFLYSFQYHIYDSTNFNKKQHWWIMVLIIAVLNFLIAFTIPFTSIITDDYCNQLDLSVLDCFGLGLSNAIWSFLFFVLITSFSFPRAIIPSRYGNCRNTTFWKP